MSMIERLLAHFGIRKIAITLMLDEREGGYTYITSPQLPGFTFMLEPGEDENIRTFIDAIDEPLMAYLPAHFEAELRTRDVHLTGIRQSKAKNYIAELAYA